MARIPEDEIDRLKAEVSLQRLAEKRGIALRRHGAGGASGMPPTSLAAVQPSFTC